MTPPPVPALRILLVDDHKLLRSSLRLVCQDAGFEVVGEAENGAQALALARQ